MSHWKYAAPIGLAALCATGIAMATEDFVIVYNADRVPHTLLWTTGDHNDCDRHVSKGTQVIPAKSEIKLKITNESWCCVRRPGAVWYKQDLRGRKAVIRLRIDD